MIADNAMEANPIRTLVAESGNTYLYENKYVLPLGFMMDEDVIDAWDYSDLDEIEAQNRLAELLGADEPMLTEIPSNLWSRNQRLTCGEDAYILQPMNRRLWTA